MKFPRRTGSNLWRDSAIITESLLFEPHLTVPYNHEIIKSQDLPVLDWHVTYWFVKWQYQNHCHKTGGDRFIKFTTIISTIMIQRDRKDHLLGYYKRAKHPSSATNNWQNYCCPNNLINFAKEAKTALKHALVCPCFFPPGLQVAAGIICMQCCACTYPNSYGSLIPGQHTLF